MTDPDRADDRSAVADALKQGRVAFMGLSMEVAPGALVPRRETEVLAVKAIEIARAMGAPQVIDMCCGAGNLACAIAHHVPDATVWASDLTDACVELTARNIASCGVSARASVHRGNAFDALRGRGLEGRVDVIVCNPPYISEKRLAEDRAALLELEPKEAFAAGPYGISMHQKVIRDAAAFLRECGVLLMEIGVGQQRQVESLFQRSKAYSGIEAVQDDSGETRVVLGRRSN